MRVKTEETVASLTRVTRPIGEADQRGGEITRVHANPRGQGGVTVNNFEAGWGQSSGKGNSQPVTNPNGMQGEGYHVEDL